MVHNNQNPRHSHPIPKLPSVPAQSNALQSDSQHPSRKTHRSRSEANWVAFPPLPEAALQSFSSAVQFVSTTLKPLTEPSIAYPSGPLPNHLSRANSLLSSSSRLNSFSASNYPAPSSSAPSSSYSNGGLKRSRTTTSSTLPTSMSRKRSKSDFGSVSYRVGPVHQLSRENTGRVIPSGQTQGFGSSTSLTHLNAPRSTRQRSRTPDPHNPAMLLRQKQRLSETSAEISSRKRSSNPSPYPQYIDAAVRSSSSLKSSASVASIGTLYPSRSRAHSQLNTISSDLQKEDHQLGPVRKTYLGGVGVYLNHAHDDENSQDEDDCPRVGSASSSKPKPHLTINVGLCKNGPDFSKNAGNWYSRLLISPLSSAGSSVYSYLVNSASTSVGTADTEGSQEQEGAPEKELTTIASASKPGTLWKQPFRRHK